SRPRFPRRGDRLHRLSEIVKPRQRAGAAVERRRRIHRYRPPRHFCYSGLLGASLVSERERLSERWTRMKGNLFSQLSRFLDEVGGELKKTTWPLKAEVIASTRVVLGSILVVGCYMALIDYLLVFLARQPGLWQ